MPPVSDSRPDAALVLDEPWTASIWVGKSQKSDECIIVVGDEARLARSVRRKSATKRWSEKLLEKVL